MASSFFDASEDCVKIVGLDGALLAMNANGMGLMDINDFEQFRGRQWGSMWPEAERQTIEEALATAKAGRGTRFTADCATAAGTIKSWEVAVWPVLDNDGRPVQVISISRDVTERRRIEEERSLFAQELAHRIKNMFAVVDGVILLSARAVQEAKPFADGLRRRLAGLGRAIAYVAPPEMASRDDTQDHTIQGLLNVVLQPYGATGGEDQRVFVSGDDAPLGLRATTTLALIFNELATNALKYGALSALDGRVDLGIAAEAEALRMTWRESSPGFKTPKSSDGEGRLGFGSALLENAVVRQLAGQVDRRWAPDGLIVTMRFQAGRFAL